MSYPFRLVEANYTEYKTVLNEYSKIYCENANMAESYLEEMVFNLNRLMINFLSAVRTFLDHTETNLKRTYGKESENLKTFKKNCSSCYDNYFSYRFLYKLRNYSQHVGMPITGIDAASDLIYINPLAVDYMLRITTLKSDLLKYEEWGRYIIYDKCNNSKKIEIKDEISRLPDQVDINPYIDELMDCIEKINNTLFGREEFIELLQHTAFLDKLVKEASVREGAPCILVQVQDISNIAKSSLIFSPKYRIIYEHFPLNAMEFVDRININSKGCMLES